MKNGCTKNLSHISTTLGNCDWQHKKPQHINQSPIFKHQEEWHTHTHTHTPHTYTYKPYTHTTHKHRYTHNIVWRNGRTVVV